jgi:hypothetical protein
VLDPSVSGKHAELVVDSSGALLRDLGSTNGTRVNGERISEQRLRAGDQVVFGNIGLIFVDESAPVDSGMGLELEIDEPEPSATPARAARAEPAAAAVSSANAADAGEAVRSIGAEKLARSGKRSALAFLGLGVLAVGAGAAWWFTRGAGPVGGPKARRPVVAVAGNLLASSYSFESADLPAEWSNDANAGVPFEADLRSRKSGEQGLSADLGPGAGALLVSQAVPAGKGLTLSAALGTEGRIEIRAGLRFESSAGACLPVEAWGPWRTLDGPLEDFELSAAAPAAYDRARAVIAARSTSEAGRAMVDDVSLVPGASGGMKVQRKDDLELVLLGEPAGTALLHKIDHTLVSGIRFVGSGGNTLALAAADDPSGLRVSTAGPLQQLEFVAEVATAADGIATTGADGFKSHQVQFERANVDSVLVGAGRDLVRVRFDPPVSLRGRPVEQENGASFVLEAAGANTAVLQVNFNEERVACQSLAREAHEAERAGKPALVIAAWSELINKHPIDATFVAEAEAGRAKALSAGLVEVATVRADVERARFFRLLDLFRQCRAQALATAEKYKGSEVEANARALAESVDGDIATLARDLDRLEASRLAQIHAALTATKQTRLAERVAQELKTRFGVGDPAELNGKLTTGSN